MFDRFLNARSYDIRFSNPLWHFFRRSLSSLLTTQAMESISARDYETSASNSLELEARGKTTPGQDRAGDLQRVRLTS